jgi:glutamate formiminotransferase
MRAARGVHPRLGAVDVVAFVPLGETAMAEAVSIAHRFGRTIAEQFGLPIYFYGEAATRPERRELPEIRRGEYEGLPAKLADPAWAPDAGPATFNPRSGAMLVGARRLLVAFNVWLEGSDLAVAQAIARAIRQSSGGLPGVQAIGVKLLERGAVQVAINLTDYRRTSLRDLLAAVRRETDARGAKIARGELVGLLPRDALGGASLESLDLDLKSEQILEAHLPKA